MQDPHELDQLFSDRREVHVYALADLDEPLWSASSWYRRGDAAVGIVDLGPSSTVYAVSTLDPGGTLRLLADLAPALSGGQVITGPDGMAAILRGRGLAWEGKHVKYHLADPTRMPPPGPRVIELTAENLDELESLYSEDPGAAFFLPQMVADGGFVGIRVGGRLVAAAGTHVVSDRRRVAAIGSMYVARAFRRRGFARAAIAGVVGRIKDRVDTIGLNVAADNSVATAIYESLGFAPVHSYEEAELA